MSHGYNELPGSQNRPCVPGVKFLRGCISKANGSPSSQALAHRDAVLRLANALVTQNLSQMLMSWFPVCPVPRLDTKLNGLRCPACYASSSDSCLDETVDCVGAEAHCIDLAGYIHSGKLLSHSYLFGLCSCWLWPLSPL